MSTYPSLPIDDVIETLVDYRGATPKKSESGVKLITAKVIKDGFIIDGNHEYIPEETFDYVMRRGIAHQWDILITSEAPLGSVAQLRTTEKVALAQRVFLLRGDPAIIDQSYFFYALQSPDFRGELHSRGTGTTVIGIRQPELRKTPLPVPPLPIQYRIASILSAYDDLIENNTQRIKALEAAAQALYREWFVEFRFPGWEQVEWVEIGEGRVPVGWQWVTFGDVCESITSGGTPRTTVDDYWGGDIPWLSSGETRNWVIVETEKMITELGVKESSTRLARKGATVIASAGQGNTRGQVSLLMLDCYVNQSVIVLMPDNDIVSDLFVFFNLARRYDELRGISDSSSSRGSITTRMLAEMYLLLPSLELIKTFDTMVRPMIEQLRTLAVASKVLRETRDLLLPRLISGELSVEGLPLPE